MKKNIGFILNINKKIGGGHFWRCFHFSKIFTKKSCSLFFITNILNDDYKKILSNEEIKLIQTRKLNNYQNIKRIIQKKKIEILIIDDYDFNSIIKKKLKKILKKLIVIDDFVKKKHFCDIYINNSLLDIESLKNIKKLNPNCKLLLGPKYCVLNPKIQKLKISNNNKVKKIFIFFGTSDNSGLTLKILNYLKKFNQLKLDIVVGNMNKNKHKIKKYCKNISNINIYNSPTNNKLIDIMSKNDLAIGAGGVNLYERLFLGLPSIVINNARNQLVSSKNLAKKKIIEYLGIDTNLTKKKFERSLKNILHSNKYKLLKSKTNYYFSSHRKKKNLLNKMNKLLKLNCE